MMIKKLFFILFLLVLPFILIAGNFQDRSNLWNEGYLWESGGEAATKGSTANLAKGTTLPQNLKQQLAVKEVMSNPLSGNKLPIKMTDPRWPASDGWIKMQKIVTSGGEPINVHYLYNTATGLVDDFKIVLPGARP